MENHLINAARSYFDYNAISQLASQENLSTEQVQQGLETAIPSLLLGFQQKSGGALQGILNQVKEFFVGNDFSESINTLKTDPQHGGFADKISDLLPSLFGEGFGDLFSKLSSFLGIGSSNLISLFKSAVPSVISAITHNGSRWDANEISNELNQNKSSLLSALPAGLSLGLFSDPKVDSPHVETPVREPIVDPVKDVLIEQPVNPERERIHHPPVNPVVEERKKGGGLWWILIPLLLLALWFIFGKSCNREDKTVLTDSTATDSTLGDTSAMPSTTLTPAKESIMVTLPNDSTLNAYKGGIEDQLVAFLNSDYKTLTDDQLKERWFDFDNLNFETGTAKILPESQIQVDNIAAILRAYPDLKIKLGGYTDKTGDETVNKRISNERAVAVKDALTAKGSGKQVVDTEGYGSEFAKFDASAPESDRIKDRRVSISVRK